MFDKDGTLTETDPVFGKLLETFYQQLKNHGFFTAPLSPSDSQVAQLQSVIDAEFFSKMEWSTSERKFAAGAIAVRKTHPQIVRWVAEIQRGLEGEGKVVVVGEEWTIDALADKFSSLMPTELDLSPQTVKTCGDLSRLFGALRGRKKAAAVCTSDTRTFTEQMFGPNCLDIQKEFVGVVCADDPVVVEQGPKVGTCVRGRRSER